MFSVVCVILLMGEGPMKHWDRQGPLSFHLQTGSQGTCPTPLPQHLDSQIILGDGRFTAVLSRVARPSPSMISGRRPLPPLPQQTGMDPFPLPKQAEDLSSSAVGKSNQDGLVRNERPPLLPPPPPLTRRNKGGVGSGRCRSRSSPTSSDPRHMQVK